MANGGTWSPSALPIRAGLYANFVDAASATISGGETGTVAMPIFTYTGGSATSGKFYTVESATEANELFGAVNAKPIQYALEGGAKEVLVYAVPAKTGDATDATQYAAVRDAYDGQDFNVFVYPKAIAATEQASTKAWVANNRDEGKHFMYVAGGTSVEDANPTTGDARSAALKDEYIVNLTTGVVDMGGNNVASSDFAPYIAGLIAGTPINQSITYKTLPVSDVTKRLKNSEVESALVAGSLVFVKNGYDVLIEQGVTTDSNSQKRGKIRTTRAKQAIATALPMAAKANYIGKVDNNENGQASLIAAIKSYLETLEADNVLSAPTVTLSSAYPSVEDKVFLDISYVPTDSLERIFLTITN